MPAQGDLPEDACAAASTLTAACTDSCSWHSDLACQPLFCGPYPSDEVAGTGRRRVNETITVSCLTGFRAGSSAGNASRSFSVTCQSNCSYSAGLECLGVSCGILKLQKPDASLYASVRLARYTNDYPYSLNPAEALHPQAVSATCQEGFRGEGGTTNATCFSTFQVDCWDGAYVPQTMARCVPSVCPIFNSAHAGNASALNLSGAPPRMHDDNALSWNLTSEAGYGVAINVTCKPGHRAVSTDFVGAVMCVEPSWYVTTCGTCDWELTVSCQPVWCAAPAGSHIKSTTPAAFTRFAEAPMLIRCADGHLVVPHATSDDVYPRVAGEMCLNASYTATCQGDCSLLMPQTCQQAKCPPFSQLGVMAGKGLTEAVAHGANVSSSCPVGFRFDRTQDDEGEAQVDAKCNGNCLYSRVSPPAWLPEGQGWRKDFECRALSCGSVDYAGRVVNINGFVLLPPTGAQIIWRSDERLYTEGDIFLNDTFIVGCLQDYQRASSLAPACEFQFKVVCANDGNLRLVDHAKESIHTRALEVELQALSDDRWRTARNASMRNPNCSSDPAFLAAHRAACNGSLARPVRQPLQFSGGAPSLLLAKTWQLSWDWLLVALSESRADLGLQGFYDRAACKPLQCGCGMCPLWNTSVVTYNYSHVTSDSISNNISDSALPAGSLVSYTAMDYEEQGDGATLHCIKGHRVASHSPAAPRTLGRSCNVSHYDAANTTSSTSLTSSTSSAWNCGFEWPSACLPVTCGEYRPPKNASVTSGGWAPTRRFFYDPAAAALTVRCHAGFYPTTSNPIECRQTFQVRCDDEGQWAGHVACEPLRCSLSALRTLRDSSMPDNKTLIRLPSQLGQGWGDEIYQAFQRHVSVPFGGGVRVRCAQDYQLSEEGAIEAVCGDRCQFDSPVISCSLFAGTCPPWDTFELGPGVQVLNNPYLMTLRGLETFETRNLSCQPGYQLDNSDTPVVVAGLEALGAVAILASANFLPPPGGSSLPLPVAGASIEMPPGAWPAGAGPLSVGVFDFREAEARRGASGAAPSQPMARYRQRHGAHNAGRRLLSDGGEVVSLMLNFGPDGLQLGQPVTLTLPFEYQSAAPFRNRLFELACWKLIVATGQWEKTPYPAGLDLTTAVNWESDPPTVKCTTDSFSPYAVRATRRDMQEQALTRAPVLTTTPPPPPPPTTRGARPERQVTTPAPMAPRLAPPFECFNNWVCVGGLVAGGLVVVLALAFLAACLHRTFALRLSSKAASGKEAALAQETPEMTPEELLAHQALEAANEVCVCVRARPPARQSVWGHANQ